MNDENERSVASAGSVDGGSDIVDRLSDLSGDVGRWGGKTIGEAIDEITRLREHAPRLMLTDEEREAVEAAAGDAAQACCGEPPSELTNAWRKRAATLRSLLERLG